MAKRIPLYVSSDTYTYETDIEKRDRIYDDWTSASPGSRKYDKFEYSLDGVTWTELYVASKERIAKITLKGKNMNSDLSFDDFTFITPRSKLSYSDIFDGDGEPSAEKWIPNTFEYEGNMITDAILTDGTLQGRRHVSNPLIGPEVTSKADIKNGKYSFSVKTGVSINNSYASVELKDDSGNIIYKIFHIVEEGGRYIKVYKV